MVYRRKHADGFTLTEVIVVAVIIGILAAIAIPTYLGFLADSQIDLARNTCEMVAAAATFAHSRGLEAADGQWNVLGISDPEDEYWDYSFDQVPDPATSLLAAGFKVTASPKPKCKINDTYYFFPEVAAGGSYWGTNSSP